MLIALGSLRGAPGVTTLALAMARFADAKGWDTILVEADPEGGVIRHLLPDLSPDRDLLSFAVSARREASSAVLHDHAQPLDNGTSARVLLAPEVGPKVVRALDLIDESLVDIANHPKRMVIVDCGRIANAAASIFNAADTRWLLTLPDAPSVLSLRALYEAYPDEATRVGTILVGDEPYGPADLASIGIGVAGNLAHDPKTADAVRGVGHMPLKRFLKSKYVKSVADLLPDVPTDLHPDIVGPRGITLNAIAEDDPDDTTFEQHTEERPATVAELEADATASQSTGDLFAGTPDDEAVTSLLDPEGDDTSPAPAWATSGDTPATDTTGLRSRFN